MNYYLYFAWRGADFTINYTHNPALDNTYLQAKGYSGIRLLSSSIPLAVAHYLWKQVGGNIGAPGSGAKPGSGWGIRVSRRLKTLLTPEKGKSPDGFFEEKQAVVEKVIRRMGIAVDNMPVGGVVDRWVGGSPVTGGPGGGGLNDMVLPTEAGLEKVLQLVAGRLLFAEEITRAAGEQKAVINYELADTLQILALQKRLRVMPAVEITRPGEWRCCRCGGTEKIKTVFCPVCRLEWCPYCESCINMGEARGCRPVYEASPVQPELADSASLISGTAATTPSPGYFHLRFDLTPPQEAAARRMEEFVLTDPRSDLLIWAVCGAGKTEVTFPAIRLVLNRGGQVLLAIPRRDVVLELAPRLREAFPRARVTALYGGCKQKFERADITVATTHQALRFNSCFDMVILDEADAYPYQGSDMLRLAVERARKTSGKTVMMTATPDARLYKEACAGRRGLITIPARFHGFPLPEPLLIRERVFVSKNSVRELNPFIINKLTEMHRLSGGSFFIFVPTVKLCLETGALMQQALAHITPPGQPAVLQYSHAADPERDRKRVEFKEGGYPFLLSTTIMERGITVENAHVMVLFADYEKVFDEGTLIQMAGRAGRSAAYPDGEVLFIGENLTPAMRGACEKITRLNSEAAARGYLRCDANVSTIY